MRELRKICFVMPFHIREGRGGGAEVQAWLLAKKLAQRGFEVAYVAQSVQGKAGGAECIDGVGVHWLPYRPHFPWLGWRRLYRVLKTIDPDLIVERMASEATGVIGHYARRHGRDFAWVCPGDWVPVRWLFWRRQREANRLHAPGAAKSLVFLADALVRDLFRHFGMRRATHAFTQNGRQRQALQRNFGLDSTRIISGHAPPKEPWPSERRRREGVVLWAGTLGRHKQPLRFLELARRHRESGRRFVMIGGHADRRYRESVVSDLPKNVDWLGPRPFDETLTWFDRASVLVNTSDPAKEGFPNTFIQAWLRGVPVLTLGVDPDGMVAANRLGAVSDTVDDMADALWRLLADEAAYAAAAARVKDYALARYTVDRVADAFLEVVNPGR